MSKRRRIVAWKREDTKCYPKGVIIDKYLRILIKLIALALQRVANKIIIKFTKDSTASHIYQSRGKLKDSRANHKRVKIRTLLTKRRQNLLKYARELAEDYEVIHFVFADANVNLKLRLKEKVRNQMVFRFSNKTELAEILDIIKHFEYLKL